MEVPAILWITKVIYIGKIQVKGASILSNVVLMFLAKKLKLFTFNL